jgi:DNA-binding response OmpR family regulator
MTAPSRLHPPEPVAFALKRGAKSFPRRSRDAVLEGRLHASRSGANRLLGAIQSGTSDFILSSLDGTMSVRVTLALTGIASTEHETVDGAIVVDWSRSLVSNGKSRVSLSQTEMRLLAALLDGDGQAVSRTHLIGRVWPDDKLASNDRENALAVYVCGLRKRLQSIGIGTALQTIRRAGYRIAI